jgi:hypothetical protein
MALATGTIGQLCDAIVVVPTQHLNDLQTPPNAAGLCDVDEKVPRYDFDRLVAGDHMRTVAVYFQPSASIQRQPYIHGCDGNRSTQ